MRQCGSQDGMIKFGGCRQFAVQKIYMAGFCARSRWSKSIWSRRPYKDGFKGSGASAAEKAHWVKRVLNSFP